MDTRTAVWVSTPEKISKIVLGKTRNFSRKFRGVSAPALDKNPAARKLEEAVAVSGVCRDFRRKVPGKFGKLAGKCFPESQISLSIKIYLLFWDLSLFFEI